MGIKLDDFIESVVLHPNVQEDEEQRESAEILFKDARIAKVIELYDKFNDIKLKKMYGVWILVILCVWIGFVITFSFCQLCVEKPISDAVFITLITTSTANIIGLPLIILNYLFPNHS